MIRPDHELHVRRKARNIWLGLILGAFVALIFSVTVVKMMNGASMQGFDHQLQPELAAEQ